MGYTEKICTELMSKQLRNVQGEQEMDVEVQEQVWQQAERGSGSVAPGRGKVQAQGGAAPQARERPPMAPARRSMEPDPLYRECDAAPRSACRCMLAVRTCTSISRPHGRSTVSCSDW